MSGSVLRRRLGPHAEDFGRYRYAHLKKDVFHEGKDGKVLGYGEALAAAAIAGMPAAYM